MDPKLQAMLEKRRAAAERDEEEEWEAGAAAKKTTAPGSLGRAKAKPVQQPAAKAEQKVLLALGEAVAEATEAQANSLRQAADRAKTVLPGAKRGGPIVANPRGGKRSVLLEEALDDAVEESILEQESRMAEASSIAKANLGTSVPPAAIAPEPVTIDAARAGLLDDIDMVVDEVISEQAALSQFSLASGAFGEALDEAIEASIAHQEQAAAGRGASQSSSAKTPLQRGAHPSVQAHHSLAAKSIGAQVEKTMAGTGSLKRRGEGSETKAGLESVAVDTRSVFEHMRASQQQQQQQQPKKPKQDALSSMATARLSHATATLPDVDTRSLFAHLDAASWTEEEDSQAAAAKPPAMRPAEARLRLEVVTEGQSREEIEGYCPSRPECVCPEFVSSCGMRPCAECVTSGTDLGDHQARAASRRGGVRSRHGST